MYVCVSAYSIVTVEEDATVTSVPLRGEFLSVRGLHVPIATQVLSCPPRLQQLMHVKQ